MSTIQARQLDSLYIKLRALKLNNDDLAQENAHLSIQLHQPRQSLLIQGIDVVCTTQDDDRAIALAASSHIKQELSFLVGKELDILIRHPELLARILDGQVFTTEGKTFRIRVALIVLSETLYIHVRVLANK